MVLLSLLYQTGPTQKLGKWKRLSCYPSSPLGCFTCSAGFTLSSVLLSSPAPLSQGTLRLLTPPEGTLCPPPGDPAQILALMIFLTCLSWKLTSWAILKEQTKQTRNLHLIQITHSNCLLVLIKPKQFYLQNSNPWAESLSPCDL